MGYGGPVGPQATLNPTFATWNHVILMYCDGASFSGDRADTVPWADPQNPGKNISLHFRGRRILDFILDTLSEKYGMRTATEVLLSGGSAGGLAAYLHADYVEEYVNALNMKHGNPALSKYGVAPVSGFFLMHATGGEKEIPLYPNEMEYVFKMQNSSSGVNSKCLASYAGSPEHGYRCIFANESYAHSSAPIFPLQSAVDKWQLENIYDYDENCWGDITMDKCSAAQIERLNGYAHDLLTDISRTEKFKSAGSGAFIESCVEHVQMQGRGFNVYKIGGVSAQEALTSWWESDFQEPASKHTHLPCKLVENPLPGHSHICNPTCVSSSHWEEVVGPESSATVTDVYRTLVDFESYPEWNTFTTNVKTPSPLTVGNAALLGVNLRQPGTSQYSTMKLNFEILEVVENERVCWAYQMVPKPFQKYILGTRRCFELQEKDNSVYLRHFDINYGPISPLIKVFFNDPIQEGFQQMTNDLRTRLLSQS